MASDSEENEPTLRRQHSNLPSDGDSKTMQITMWIIGGVIAIALVYVIFYSNMFKKEKTDSQVVIPESAQSSVDSTADSALDSGLSDTTEMNDGYREDTSALSNQGNQEYENPHTNQEVIKEEPKAAPEKHEKAVSTPKKGSFTVFIGSFKKKSLAEKEEKRYNSKGEHAFIVESKGMFRVGVGTYSSRAEAKKAVEKLKSMLNNGFWIDRVE